MPVAIHDDEPKEDFPELSSRDQAAYPTPDHFRVKNIPPAAYYVPDFITRDEEGFLLKRLGETPQPKWKIMSSGRRLHYWGGNVSKKGVLLPEPLPDFLTAFPDIIQRIETFLDRTLGRDDASCSDGTTEHMLGINQVLVNEYGPGDGISPHEDGPAFRPLVVTLSLGSHTVLDLHQYLSYTSPSPPMTATPSSDLQDSTEGRPIAAVPFAHVLLMPRSLLVLSSSLYASHLHGISARTEDFVSSSSSPVSASASGGVVIANADLIGDPEVGDALRDAGSWRGIRGTRTSLTFRHAEKVLKGGALGLIHGALRRG
ncbi:hypothetical protein TREMEDRAFT_57997 [Tremella mesenterica DSM 1558]|uniref:uncharacterized protein n=1 Tax=Tremella mesenterica (strain ATCC 24925 / CBS 8224 / DSM 1558 / NBRC 9311 / NRRL Y-6157 / RJB 2259-6 / UBC 559-6) TaxID=578456 RepID=UPI00032BE6B1|nr:uncharacterized protein TREMEDRAFT_57997 [Tremella mesenterica DSM 1558]EIW65472.1 hypothetical protein TREMEDRAFT_57997 [Tremella mesenterica DSM 1558]